MKDNSKSDKFALSFLISLFTAFNFGFFIPMDFYLTNIEEVLLPQNTVMLSLGAVSALIFLIVFLICFLTPQKLHDICCLIFFSLSFSIYLESNFLSLSLGTLDGTQYSVSAFEGIADILVWLAIPLAALFIRKRNEKIYKNIISYLPAAIVVIEIITLGVSRINLTLSDENSFMDFVLYSSDTAYIRSTKDLNTYSTDKNVIIILTDEYDSFCFDESLKIDPDSVNGFDGFTYYSNTIGSYGFTVESIAYMTTGNKKEVSDPYENDRFFQNMKNSYRTCLYGSPALFTDDIFSRYAENYLPVEIGFNEYKNVAANMYNLTCFKCVPKLFKGAFKASGSNINDYFSGSESLMAYYPDDLSFYNNLPATLTLTEDSCFKFIYLYGLHDPRNITKDLERAANWSVSGDEQAVAMNKILSRYFDILKENGVYDNSEILLLADHGLKTHDSGMYPLLMYKPVNSDITGIETSYAPISYADLYPTFLKISGEEPDGDTIWDIPEDMVRTRRFESTGEDFDIQNIKDTQDS